MSFRSRIYALMAGIVALVLVLVLAGWWMSGRALSATDTAYTEGLKLARAIDKARSAQVNFQRQVQEWKNVLIRGGDAALRDTHWKGFEQREQLMDKELDALQAALGGMTGMTGMDGIASAAAKTRAEHGVLGQRYRDALQKYPALDAAAQQAIDVSVRGMDRPTSAGIDALVQNLQGKVKQRFADESAAAHSHMRNNLLLVGSIAAGLMALLLGAALAMARSVFNSLGAEPEHAVRATARIAGGDLTERLNAKTPKSLIGALEMMQSRLRNISLAIREVAFDIESRTTAMPQGPARELLAQTWVGGVCLVHEGRRAGRELAQLHFLRAREKLLADRELDGGEPGWSTSRGGRFRRSSHARQLPAAAAIESTPLPFAGTHHRRAKNVAMVNALAGRAICSPVKSRSSPGNTAARR